MKINKKAIIITLVMILTLIVISSTIFAATFNTSAINNNRDLGAADDKIEDIGSRIFTAVSNVGIVLSVVIVAVIGVKYMLGSVDERAEYKKSMMPYLVGAVLIFMASTIGKIIYTTFSKIK